MRLELLLGMGYIWSSERGSSLLLKRLAARIVRHTCKTTALRPDYENKGYSIKVTTVPLSKVGLVVV